MARRWSCIAPGHSLPVARIDSTEAQRFEMGRLRRDAPTWDGRVSAASPSLQDGIDEACQIRNREVAGAVLVCPLEKGVEVSRGAKKGHELLFAEDSIGIGIGFRVPLGWGLRWPPISGHRGVNLSYGGGGAGMCIALGLGNQGFRCLGWSWQAGRFGCRNGKRSTPRSVAEWRAERSGVACGAWSGGIQNGRDPACRHAASFVSLVSVAVECGG